jgi:acetyl-CoA carboxylase carboxyltransferase component
MGERLPQLRDPCKKRRAVVRVESVLSWQKELDDVTKRRALALRMGGPDKVARQHASGKLTVRERIDRLLDAGSFREVGTIAGAARYDAGELVDFVPANQVSGHGTIDARPVAVVGDDFTVRGGAADASVYEKLLYPERLAHDLRMPIVRLVDGTGGGGSVRTLESKGFTYVPALPGWHILDGNLARVPVVGLALGSVAGLGAARVAASHYALIVRETAQIFAAGPPVVAHAGQTVTKEELGGSQLHARNGTVDDEVESEDAAFARTRRFLAYLPRSVYELPARVGCDDDPGRREEMLLSIVPRDERKVYTMRPIVEAIVDRGSFLEIGRLWGRSVICGLARFGGVACAVLASDPYHYGGAWTRASSEKLTRLVDLADTFHLPIVHLVDVPGFQVGVDAERAATIRAGVRAMSAIERSSVPWCTILVRKCFGVAGAANRPAGRLSMRYAWPSGSWGSLPIAGGLEAAYRADLEAAANPQEKRAEIEARLRAVTSPVRSAEKFSIEEIIDPRDTRRLVCEFAELAVHALTPGPSQQPYRP